MPNTETPVFSGAMVNHYDQHLGPLFFEPYAIEIAGRIDPSHVRIALELASGTGRVTRHLRDRLSENATLIASDISPDMLAVAKEKLKGEDIDWEIIDAQVLPFEDNSIDLIVCCFGFMLVPDRPKAFAEAYRVLKPGGTFLFTTWDKLELNGASDVYRRAIKKYMEEPLPPNYKLPFSMHDEKEIRELVEQAGFKNITIERVQKESICATAKEAAIGLSTGGSLYNEVMKRNPSAANEITQNVEKELSEKYGAAPMKAPMQAVVTEAKK